jgi:hypothetical protein
MPIRKIAAPLKEDVNQKITISYNGKHQLEIWFNINYKGRRQSEILLSTMMKHVNHNKSTANGTKFARQIFKEAMILTFD